ncbi:cyclic nucleotide-binding domain-containing protein [Spirillospora sp. CA-294931]|uniref:Crp/Fnr family transcriptional regulator n=1 Tax=Spirillospora sp. CA-294931 TaxID=3240042 RepID=UPI003D934522
MIAGPKDRHDPDAVVPRPHVVDDPRHRQGRGRTHLRRVASGSVPPGYVPPGSVPATVGTSGTGQPPDLPPGAVPVQARPAPEAAVTRGFWSSLTDEERHAFTLAAEPVAYALGTVLWHEGEPADHLLVITSGWVRVSVERHGRERILATRGPGDLIGERAALLLRLRSATIVALDDLRLMRMTTGRFAAFLSDHPRVLAVLERQMYDRLTENVPETPPVAPMGWAPAPSGPAPARPSTAARDGEPWPATAARPVEDPWPVAARPTEDPWPVTAARPVEDPWAVAARPTEDPWPVAAARPTEDPWPVAAARPVEDPWPVAAARPVEDPWPVTVPRPAEERWPVTVARPAEEPRDGTAVRRTPAWAGQMCSILLTDITGFGSPSRNDDDRLVARRTMYELLNDAFEYSGVPWAACHREDRGDGALIVVPPEMPTWSVVDPMLARLTASLRRYNHRSSDAVRVRLRAALHVGPVMPDPEGVSGSAIIQTARLLEAPVLKEWMAKTESDLGFISSAFVYESVIAHGPGYVNPASYQRVTCSVKEAELTAWMHLSSATSV